MPMPRLAKFKNPAKALHRSSVAQAKRKGYVPMSLAECETALRFWTPYCMVCQDPCSPVVDHDHVTGEFRGWLCGRCNVAEGMLQGDHKRCSRLLNYMRQGGFARAQKAQAFGTSPRRPAVSTARDPSVKLRTPGGELRRVHVGPSVETPRALAEVERTVATNLSDSLRN